MHLLKYGRYAVSGRATIKKEFVTAGGISLEEVDPHTRQSQKVPGLGPFVHASLNFRSANAESGAMIRTATAHAFRLNNVPTPSSTSNQSG